MATWEQTGIDPLAAQIVADIRKIVECADKDIAAEVRAEVLAAAAIGIRCLMSPAWIKDVTP